MKTLLTAMTILALTATAQAGEAIPQQFHGAWCESKAVTPGLVLDYPATEYRRGQCPNGITVTASGYSSRTDGRCGIRWIKRNGAALQAEFACTVRGESKKEIQALCFLEARDPARAVIIRYTQCLEE
jgi:hypothetical protein